jgi:uncharacterized protein
VIRLRHLALLSLAASAIALATAAGAGAAEAPALRTVSVSARAAVTVPNDSARLSFAVSRERRSRGAALRAASAKLSAVIHAVKRFSGVGPGDVRTGRISVRKVSRGNATVYRASQGIGVTLHQADQAGELVAKAVSAGATGVGGPTFFVGDTEAAFSKALGAAFDKAKARAAALAAKAGATLGQALEIDEGELAGEGSGSFDGSSFGGKEAAPEEAAPPPTKPGTSKVTATVHVVFELL